MPMTILGRALLAAAALTLAAGPALALTVANRHDKALEVTTDLGMEEPKTKVDAGQSAKLDCPNGCELRVPTMSYGLAAKEGDKVVIGKDGMLAYEDHGADKSRQTN
jgi:hypothetical protein